MAQGVPTMLQKATENTARNTERANNQNFVFGISN